MVPSPLAAPPRAAEVAPSLWNVAAGKRFPEQIFYLGVDAAKLCLGQPLDLAPHSRVEAQQKRLLGGHWIARRLARPPEVQIPGEEPGPERQRECR